MTATIGVDIGGTKISAGVVDDDGVLVDRLTRATPAQDPEAIEAAVADAVAHLRAGLSAGDVSAVGVAAAGFVDAERSTVRHGTNIAWRDRPLRAALERLIGLDVVVENDANAAAWAEYRFGAGHGHGDVQMVTLGTGVGGGVVIRDRLVRGAMGFAGELGHVRAVVDGRQCGCGQRGCWEQYISGNALVARARELAADPDWSPQLLRRAGGSADGISGPLVTELAAEGDVATRDLVAELGESLGRFCATLAAVLDPALFVIGGGVGEAGDLLLAPARESLAGALSPRGGRAPIPVRAAELGNDAGIVGAADLARTGD